MPEPTAYTDDLRKTSLTIFERLGLQRARVRGVSVRLEELAGAAAAAEQISLDREKENGRRLDPVVDRLNQRFGPGTVTRGSLAHRRSA
jgi:hypothetical protein